MREPGLHLHSHACQVLVAQPSPAKRDVWSPTGATTTARGATGFCGWGDESGGSDNRFEPATFPDATIITNALHGHRGG